MGTYAADLTAASNQFLSSSAVDLSTGAFTLVCWMKPNTLAGNLGLFSQDDGTARDWGAYESGVAGNVYFYGFSGGAIKLELFVGLLSPGSWSMVALTYDGVDTMSFSGDNSAWQDAVLAGALDADGDDLEIGRQGPTQYWDGLIAYAATWSAKLNQATALTPLYTRGPTFRYTDTSPAQRVNMTHWWNFEEASGARSDSHGSNNLTDNNKVGRAKAVYP